MTKGTELRKEIKVRIPIEQHVQLHTRKVLTGETITRSVTESLSAYLDQAFEQAGLEDALDDLETA